MSIPKIIHLCWFGKGEYPALARMCIDSWHKFLPDYEIKIWNEETFDINSNEYTRMAYGKKKWAFVSDYVRLKALYEEGGVYMDTDLEVIKNFTYLLENRKFVSSYIEGGLITAGFIASEPHHRFIKEIKDYYDNQANNIKDGKTVDLVMNPLIFSYIAKRQYGFSVGERQYITDELTILPLEYFMPYRKVPFGKNKYAHSKYKLTSNTYTIHHDMGSWAKTNNTRKILLGLARLVFPETIYNGIKIRGNRKRINNSCF